MSKRLTRMAVEGRSEALLVEMVADKANAPSKDEQSVKDPDLSGGQPCTFRFATYYAQKCTRLLPHE